MRSKQSLLGQEYGQESADVIMNVFAEPMSPEDRSKHRNQGLIDGVAVETVSRPGRVVLRMRLLAGYLRQIPRGESG